MVSQVKLQYIWLDNQFIVHILDFNNDATMHGLVLMSVVVVVLVCRK